MARLSKTIEAQANMQHLPEEVKLALMMSVSIVQVAMMPLVLAASYMVVNYTRNPAILSRVIQRVIALQVMMIDALVVLLEEVERMIAKDPGSAPIAMSLIVELVFAILQRVEITIIINVEIIVC